MLGRLNVLASLPRKPSVRLRSTTSLSVMRPADSTAAAAASSSASCSFRSLARTSVSCRSSASSWLTVIACATSGKMTEACSRLHDSFVSRLRTISSSGG